MGLLRSDQRAGDDDFVAYYVARADHLRATAYLLCGDWHLAQDLTQIAFTKLYRVWGRVERHDTLDQYARRVAWQGVRVEYGGGRVGRQWPWDGVVFHPRRQPVGTCR